MHIYVMKGVFFFFSSQSKTWPLRHLRSSSGAASAWTPTSTPSPSRVDITFAWTASKATGTRRTIRSVRCAKRRSENARTSGSTEDSRRWFDYWKGLFTICFCSPPFSHDTKESSAFEFILCSTQIERPQPDLPEPEEHLSEGEEVPCDICQGDKSTSVKSCLVCQTSYCELHLAAHRRNPALQKHRLTEPATFPSNHLCRKHNKPLTMFCKTDQMPVCVKCSERDHKHHESVPMEKESKRIKVRKSLFQLFDWNLLSLFRGGFSCTL